MVCSHNSSFFSKLHVVVIMHADALTLKSLLRQQYTIGVEKQLVKDTVIKIRSMQYMLRSGREYGIDGTAYIRSR